MPQSGFLSGFTILTDVHSSYAFTQPAWRKGREKREGIRRDRVSAFPQTPHSCSCHVERSVFVVVVVAIWDTPLSGLQTGFHSNLPPHLSDSAMCCLNKSLTDLSGLSLRKEGPQQADILKGSSDCCFGKLCGTLKVKLNWRKQDFLRCTQTLALSCLVCCHVTNCLTYFHDVV